MVIKGGLANIDLFIAFLLINMRSQITTYSLANNTYLVKRKFNLKQTDVRGFTFPW